jgi:hypothetical protein
MACLEEMATAVCVLVELGTGVGAVIAYNPEEYSALPRIAAMICSS